MQARAGTGASGADATSLVGISCQLFSSHAVDRCAPTSTSLPCPPLSEVYKPCSLTGRRPLTRSAPLDLQIACCGVSPARGTAADTPQARAARPALAPHPCTHAPPSAPRATPPPPLPAPLDLHPYRDTVTVTVAPTLTQTHTVMLTLTLAPTRLPPAAYPDSNPDSSPNPYLKPGCWLLPGAPPTGEARAEFWREGRGSGGTSRTAMLGGLK